MRESSASLVKVIREDEDGSYLKIISQGRMIPCS